MRLQGLFRISLRYRFILSMGLMLVPLLAVALSAVFSLHGQRRLMMEIIEEFLHEKEPIMVIQDGVHRAALLLTGHLQDGGGEETSLFGEIEFAIDQAFAQAKRLPFGLEIERKSMETAFLQWQKMKDSAAAIFSPTPSDETARIALFHEVYAEHMKISGALQLIQEKANEEIAETESGIRIVEKRTVWTVLITFAVGIVIVLLVGMRLARSVLQPMRALGLGAEQLTSGNLDHRIVVNREDEFGVLVKTFNEMAAALHQGQETLRNLAVRDSLTNLYNHREFFRLLQEEVDRACRYDHPLSLLMIDLDRFKEINDSFGHLAGDRVLLHVATVIGRQIRKSDHASRYGGDEFAVLLPETDLPEAFDFAQRLQKAVTALPIAMGNDEKLTISLSIGVASFPEEASTYLQLVAASDRALYRAKKSLTQKVCCRRDASG